MGHLITPWLVAQGMEQCWHIPPCSRDTCRVVVSGKTFPRGSFPTTHPGRTVGRQVPRHRELHPWLDAGSGSVAALPGVAGMEGLLPGVGMSLGDVVSRKQKGLAAPSTGDCAVQE